MVSLRATAAAVLSLLFGPLAWAQDPVVAHVGSIVRITAPSVSPKRLVGTLDGANESFLRLSTPTGAQVISRNAIERLEWSRGLHKPVLKRTLEGAVVLGAFGFVFGTAGHDPNEKEPLCGKRIRCAAVGAGVGAVVGLAASAFAQPQHDWADVPGVRRVRVIFRPRPDGLAAALVMRW
jgi:hypothetical protein